MNQTITTGAKMESKKAVPKKRTAAVKEVEPAELISAYKGFDKNLQCRGFQFEVGKTYQHNGEVKACSSGFHSCENPLDILSYYPLIDNEGQMTRFATVKASGSVSRHVCDSKVASASLTVEAEIKLPEFISAAVKWIANACTAKETSDSGYSSQLAASGDSSRLAASGDSSQLAASGHSSRLAASGHCSQLAASGDSSRLAASGASSIAIAAATNCTASVGPSGCIVLTRWIESEKRYRVSVGYEGENGIKAGVFYKLSDDGEFIEE